ncbi:hypothetical protein [Microbulbifer guangxiensis]|uniref:hypothetical protein n=1 Tax=Microbulbifer guangxiensis TaxID=2904249 RepID=UPI001F1DD852|nr:hypothetical protein [Microbulbifer guangxiensis]
MKLEQAEQRAVSLLGGNALLEYCGLNVWPFYIEPAPQGEFHVFRYQFADEARIGSDRYIAIGATGQPFSLLFEQGE